MHLKFNAPHLGGRPAVYTDQGASCIGVPIQSRVVSRVGALVPQTAAQATLPAAGRRWYVLVPVGV